MKILAIRGKNLASLAAPFVVDFQAEPLASAGLYAITGPTGSGKSTLLDALCLALYERTPRLAKAAPRGESIPDVGEHEVSPSDPRNLLRRGAAEGFAEVDFIGCDSVAYRARWSVRRARGKGDGRLQNSEMSLRRIADDQNLSDTRRTETLRLIEERIGLSFEQFTRAVLLAQNDFATFLKAPDDERAELLQTLTGTETFAAISRQAYARMKAENETLTRLEVQLQDQKPLAPEARAEKDAALQARTADAQVLGTRQAAIEGHQRWHVQLIKHQQELDVAQARCEAAVAALAAAAPRQAQLTLVENVQSARPLWVERERVSLAAAAAAQAQADAAAAQAQGLVLAQTCASAFALAQAAETDAESARLQAQPALDQARVIDASLQAVKPEFDDAVQAQADAQTHLDAQSRLQVQAAAQLSQAQAELHTIERWLSDHAALRVLSEAWPRWDTLFTTAQALLASRHRVQTETRALAAQGTATGRQLQAAQTAQALAAAQANTAVDQLAVATQACVQANAEELAQGKQALEDRRDQVQVASLLWHQRSEVRGQRQRLQEQLQQLGATLAESERVVRDCAERAPLLSGALDSAEQAWHLAQMAASENAENLRAQLQPDAPCPVCGALDHPYAEQAPAVNAVLQSLQAHVRQSRQALRELQQREAVAQAAQTNAAKALEQGRLELERLAVQRDALLRDWAALALQAELDAVPEPERTAWLAQQQDQTRQTLAGLSAQEALHRKHLKQKDAAQQAVNSAHQALDQAREAHTRLAASAAQTSQALGAAQSQLDALAQQLDATLAQLDSAFADPLVDAPSGAQPVAAWRAAWAAEPDQFAARCRTDAEAWADRQASHAGLTQALAQMRVRLSALEDACAQATQQLTVQSARRQTAESKLQGYREARAHVLQGLPVVAVEARLDAALAQAKAALAAALSTLHTAQAEAARLQEAQRLATEQRAQLDEAFASAQAALVQWLADFNAEPPTRPDAAALSLEELKNLLDLAPAWIAQERQAWQALQSEVTTAEAVRDTRQQSLAQHAAARATADSAESLQAQLDQATADITALTQALSDLKTDIARDDERLATSLALRARIDEQMAFTRVWSQLGELIGSADGKKFRNFAQQLTLDILLGYGNRHLQGLTSRYRLERIPASLGLLVVDQDMGDEVRSVHSLSGGESFLVSLAMALGLASLSSHRVRVESLFIDEGFGSLDADALRLAMDALDSLQSQGRKVGVISHVQEMTERIGTQVQVRRRSGGLSDITVV